VAVRRDAWASCSAMKRPVPSHHGHATVFGSPPRFEITEPVARQGEQGRSAMGDWSVTCGRQGSGTERTCVVASHSRAGDPCLELHRGTIRRSWLHRLLLTVTACSVADPSDGAGVGGATVCAADLQHRLDRTGHLPPTCRASCADRAAGAALASYSRDRGRLVIGGSAPGAAQRGSTACRRPAAYRFARTRPRGTSSVARDSGGATAPVCAGGKPSR
jgi:hypothetical protein